MLGITLCMLGLQAAATRAAQVLADFTPQAVANLMWAFAAFSHNPGKQLHVPCLCLHP